MESLYRQLIEENGGIFEYHDGHIKGGKKALENRIMRADIVLCSVNINSHNACSVVKKMGKKHRKSVQMLTGSGLGVICQALSECQEVNQRSRKPWIKIPNRFVKMETETSFVHIIKTV